jgi:hypothetical protein
LKLNKLIILDPDLRDKNFGHFYTYDNSVKNIFLQNNVETLIFCSKLYSKSSSEQNIINNIRDYQSKYFKIFEFFLQQLQIYNLLKKITKNRYTHVFIPNLDFKLFFPLIFILILHPNIENISLLYRYSKDSYFIKKIKFNLFYKIFFKLKTLQKNKIKLFTDSELLIEEAFNNYNIILNLLPIPHIIKNPKANDFNNKINSIYLPGRLLKGKMFEYVYNEYLENHIKLPSLKLQKGADLLFDNIANDIKLKFICLNEFLERDRLIEEMINSEIILLPYSGIGYKTQTSGFFTESVALGKIVIVGNNTWMSKQIDLNYASGIVIDIKQKNSLISAIKNIEDNFEYFRSNAVKKSIHWLEMNSPENFYKIFFKIVTNA